MSQPAISSVIAQPALVALPDDVLIRILQQLNLQTQLDLTNVHIRFLTIMPHVWRSQCKNINFGSIVLPLRDKDLRFFLGSNQQTLKVLKLSHRYIFNVLTNYVFPNLHDLVLGSFLVKFDKSCVLKAIKTFPNLRSFTPIGEFTGKHFEKFSQLENLTLTSCQSFESSNLLRILETCKLKTLKLGIFNKWNLQAMALPFQGIQFLEVLKCNEWEMKWFIKELHNLEHLKQVILCDKPAEFFIIEIMTAVSHKNINSFEVTDDNFDFIHVLNEVNVQIPTVKVSANWFHLLDEYQHLEAIKISEIYLNSCVIVGVDILHSLFSMKICETIVIESCLFINIFKYTFNTRRIVNGRRTKLHLYLYNNKCVGEIQNQDPMKWELLEQHPLLEVHMDQKPNISYSSERCSILLG